MTITGYLASPVGYTSEEKMRAAQKRMRRATKRLTELRLLRGALLVGLLGPVALEIEAAGKDIAEAIRIAKEA